MPSLKQIATTAAIALVSVMVAKKTMLGKWL